MKWIRIKDQIPPCDSNDNIPYVLAYHVIHGIGVAWFWKFTDKGIVEELEEQYCDKYICSCQFIFNTLDGNNLIRDEDDIDIFENSPHFYNLGTVTHWMPLPGLPHEADNQERSE